MPTTEERYTERLGLRIEPELRARLERKAKAVRPRVNLTEYIRRVLWESVTTKPQTQQQKEQ